MLRLNIYGSCNNKIYTKKDYTYNIWWYLEGLSKLNYESFCKKFSSKNITKNDFDNLKFEIIKIGDD